MRKEGRRGGRIGPLAGDIPGEPGRSRCRCRAFLEDGHIQAVQNPHKITNVNKQACIKIQKPVKLEP